jgi:hypothetical protein
LAVPAIRWTKNEGKFKKSFLAILGEQYIGEIHESMMRVSEKNMWQVVIHLPGATLNHKRYETEELARAALEESVSVWLGRIGVK